MARFAPCLGRQWSLGSAGEHRLHTAGVTGSNPVATTMRQQVIGCFCRWPFFFPASGAPLGRVGGSSFEAREYEVKTLAVGLQGPAAEKVQAQRPKRVQSGSLRVARLRGGKADGYGLRLARLTVMAEISADLACGSRVAIGKHQITKILAAKTGIMKRHNRQPCQKGAITVSLARRLRHGKATAATPGLVRRGRTQAAPVSLAGRRLRHGKATAAACALRLAGRGLAGRRPPRPALPGSCPPPCRGLLCRRLLERGPSAKFNKRSASWAWRIARTCGKMLTVRATARAESRNAEACGNAGDAR